MVSRSLHQPQPQALSPDDHKLLREVVAGLVGDFGLGPVKQEINRRPKRKDNGRPKVWDNYRLFSLWLIVQTWALRGNLKINGACGAIEKAAGGLTTDTEGGGSIVLENAKIIRKQFYKADAALDAYDSARPTKERSGSLRERLKKQAYSLSENATWFSSGPELASQIVEEELDYVDAGTSGTVYYVLREDEVDQRVEAGDPPTPRTDRAELEGKVAHLKARFGEQPLREMIRLFPEPKEVGHPKMWYDIRLLTLWFIVRHFASLENMNIRDACKRIEQMGGVFEHINDEWVAWSRVASTAQQIRRLYYDGESAIDKFESAIRSKSVPDCRARPLKLQLQNLAIEMARRKILILPVLEYAMQFVLRTLREDRICGNHTIEFLDAAHEADTGKLKFAPSENGRWVLKGVPLSDPHPFLNGEDWEQIFWSVLATNQGSHPAMGSPAKN
jgi:hypothetical protein